MLSQPSLSSLLPLLSLSPLPFISASPVSPSLQAKDNEVHNANHIFNALHSSMRQWGSSLNHNGMSFFLASVPAGTQVYHGTWRNESVTGTEWLAFEAEHALIFARGRMGGGRPPGDGEGGKGRGGPLRGVEEVGDSGDKKENCHLEKHGSGGPWWKFWDHDGRGEDRKEYGDDGKGWRHYGPPLGPGEHEHWGNWKHEHPPPPPDHFPPPPDLEFPPPPPGHHRRPPFEGHPEDTPHHDGRPFPGPPPHHDHEREHEHEKASGPFARPPPPPPFDRHRDRRDDPPHRQNPLRLHPHDFPPPFPPPPHIHNTDDNGDQRTGYLHTYAPKRALTLLYIDGMSAGKTTNGTLDSQDMLLLNLTDPGNPDDHGGMFREHERAEGLCNMSATLWEGKVDGFLRMEGGFEIILCEFETSLDVQSIMPVVASEGPGGGGVMGGWRYQQAVASRYHGIGGRRVVLDYEYFVTAYAYEGLDLFDNDGQSDVPMPRLTKARAGDLRRIREDVTDMVLSADIEKIGDGTDWQSVADMLVQRYSAPLHHLGDEAAAVRKSKDALTLYLATLMRPFIDYTARNSSIETERCVAQVLPPVPPPSSPSLAHTVVEAVAGRVCSTLITALDITTASQSVSPLSEALHLIDALIVYLQWTTWKECGACPDEELCVIPIWPMGTFEDHASPRCKAESEQRGVNGYWGHWGPPGGRRPRPPPGEGGDRDGGRLRGMEV